MIKTYTRNTVTPIAFTMAVTDFDASLCAISTSSHSPSSTASSARDLDSAIIINLAPPHLDSLGIKNHVLNCNRTHSDAEPILTVHPNNQPALIKQPHTACGDSTGLSRSSYDYKHSFDSHTVVFSSVMPASTNSSPISRQLTLSTDDSLPLDCCGAQKMVHSGSSLWQNIGKHRFNVGTKYRVCDVIGEGAYGVVCSAIHRTTGQKVAIKKIQPFEHQMFALRTLRELKLLRYFQEMDVCENIISILDVIKPPSLEAFHEVYLIQELMETDLHRVVRSQKLSDDHGEKNKKSLLLLTYSKSAILCLSNSTCTQSHAFCRCHSSGPEA